MLRKWLALVVVCSILNASNWAVAAPQVTREIASGVKDQVRVLRSGSRLEVKLKNGDKLKGRLGSVDEDRFEIQVSQRGRVSPVQVTYTDVQSLHGKNGMSTGTKIGLELGIFVGMAGLVAYLVLSAIARNG